MSFYREDVNGLPPRASDAGPDNPISPDSEIRSGIADAAFQLKQAENAIAPLPTVREVREMLDEILNAWDGAPLRAGRQAEPDHASEARALADINRRLAEEFGI